MVKWILNGRTIPKVVFLLKKFSDLTESGNADILDLIYERGNVYLPIPADQKGKGKVKVVGLIFQEQSYGIALQFNSPYREKINVALLKLVENGIYKEIHDKWFGS